MASLVAPSLVATVGDGGEAQSLSPLHRFDLSLFAHTTSDNVSSLLDLNYSQSILLDPFGGACCGGLHPPGDAGVWPPDAWIAPPRPVGQFSASLAAFSDGRVLMIDGAYLIMLSPGQKVEQWPLSVSGCDNVTELFATDIWLGGAGIFQHVVAFYGCGSLTLLDVDAIGSTGAPQPLATIDTSGLSTGNCDGTATHPQTVQLAWTDTRILLLSGSCGTSRTIRSFDFGGASVNTVSVPDSYSCVACFAASANYTFTGHCDGDGPGASPCATWMASKSIQSITPMSRCRPTSVALTRAPSRRESPPGRSTRRSRRRWHGGCLRHRYAEKWRCPVGLSLARSRQYWGSPPLRQSHLCPIIGLVGIGSWVVSNSRHWERGRGDNVRS